MTAEIYARLPNGGQEERCMSVGQNLTSEAQVELEELQQKVQHRSTSQGSFLSYFRTRRASQGSSW